MLPPMNLCACGAEATANGRECPSCFRDRIASVGNGHTPTRRVGRADTQRSKRHVRRLERYADARRQGMQPATTQSRDIEIADRISQETGEAFSARTA